MDQSIQKPFDPVDLHTSMCFTKQATCKCSRACLVLHLKQRESAQM